MATIGRRKGVRRYGTAHGLRMSETMEYVCREYARKVGVSLSDGMRLLLEQAVGQRVNAVEAQQAQLDRIEEELARVGGQLGDLDAGAGKADLRYTERLNRVEAKLADLEGSLAHVEQTTEAIQVALDPPAPGEALSPEEQDLWYRYERTRKHE